MEISKKSLEQFKKIYKKEFKEEIDDTTARILARRLLNLYKAVYRPNKNNKEKYGQE